jgi:hypothetical protein
MGPINFRGAILLLRRPEADIGGHIAQSDRQRRVRRPEHGVPIPRPRAKRREPGPFLE